jgi:ElaB/YqjD/DUF883 family membrane-anchored ribosome-binding protein
VLKWLKVKAMETPEDSSRTQERLIDDLRLVIENAEELLRNTDHYSSVLYQNAREKLALALDAANEELSRFEDTQLSRMIAATHAANEKHADKTGEERILRAFHYH